MIPIHPVNFPNNVNQTQPHEVIYESLDGSVRVKRTGHCSQCGNCCDDTENIFAERDGNNNPIGLTQVVPGKCAYFRWLEDGKSACVGRDTLYYKNGCNIWPSVESHVSSYTNCTFKFEQIS